VGIQAVVSAPERRCQDTALAVTIYNVLPPAHVDSQVTSKISASESNDQRAARGLAAVQSFLGSTSGDVAVVSHGHLIQLMTLSLQDKWLGGSEATQEIVNAGVVKWSVSVDGKGGYSWTLLSEDPFAKE